MQKLILCLLILWSQLIVAENFPSKPNPSNFFVDEANIIDTHARTSINRFAEALLNEKQVPLYVVTIPSLAKYDAYEIQSFTADLFNHWGIGWQDKNFGVLLLVSTADRKARIELGSDWGNRYDYDSQKIMNQLIIPQFKNGDYSSGIVNGIRGIDSMIRGVSPPQKISVNNESGSWFSFSNLAIFILIAMMVVNLFKTGKTGWAWTVLTIIGMILMFILSNMGDGSSGGGSHGGFGGGSSGGGGATGSW